MAEQKSITISTIPIPKLTVLMNNFICNTVTHLNKLSVKGDEKLAEFDKKLNDLEIMTTLLEAKLNSLPENIKSSYPNGNTEEEIPVLPPEPIKNQRQDNAGNENQNTNQNNKNEEDTKVESKEQASDGEGGEDDNLPPEEALENFLKQHEKYRNVFKMLKLGVPTIGVRQKVKTSGLDSDIFEQLIVLAHKAYPSISLD
jgi:hypothetical protein